MISRAGRLLGAGACMLATACSGGSGGGGGTEGAGLRGIWVLTSGNGFFEEGPVLPDTLDLQKDGAGAAYLEIESSGVRDCRQLTWSPLDKHVLGIEIEGHFGPQLLVYDKSGDTLELTTRLGERLVYEKADGVPDLSHCLAPAALTLTSNFAIAPADFSGVIGDASTILFKERLAGRIVQVDVATLSTVGGFTLTGNYTFPLTRQGADIWGANSYSASLGRKTTADVVVDEVDLTYIGPEPAFTRYVYGASWSDDTNTLRVLVSDDGQSTASILELDTDAEPDVLLSTIVLPSRPGPSALASRAGELWVLVYAFGNGQLLVRLDAATGSPTGSFLLPRGPAIYDWNWQGVTFVGTSMYVLGYSYSDETGLLLEVEGL